jgi:hypothetical protein
MRAAGTVGCCAKNSDPSSPDSSAVTNTNSCERFGFCGAAAAARATARMSATPEALSSAPL